MASVTNWIEHLSTDVDAATEGVQVGSIYPGVGTEGILVLILAVLWIGWHFISNMQEKSKSDAIARRRPGSNDWKSNVTDG